MKTYTIEQLDSSGQLVATVSGFGRNAGTWDAEAYSKRTAQRWLSEIRKQNPKTSYRIATNEA